MTDLRIALVGPEHQENIGLEYLAAAAERAGCRARVIRYDDRRDLAACVREVAEATPALVGVSIPFQHGVDDALELVAALRRGGYEGHVTCGGHVPTFCAEELLAAAPGIDTAVRHDGEETLVAMLRRLKDGEPLRGIPGIVRREGARMVSEPPHPLSADIDALPWPKRRRDLLTVGGVPAAFLITTRGCSGSCAYCCIRAYARDAGGPPLRLRDPGAVAEEVGALYHRQGARAFFVQDDLFVLTDEIEAIARMQALRNALEERRVDRPVFWIKGRPETMTPEIVTAARDMGAIHMFLGIESASRERLRYLGRTHTPADAHHAIALCRAAGVRPSFNLMLFDPDSTLENAGETIDFAGKYLDIPWNVCRTEVYPGTAVFDRLRKAGRLTGSFRGYGYEIADPRAEIMFRILRVCLLERAFACDSLHNKLISVSFARQLLETRFPGEAAGKISAETDALLAEGLGDTVATLRRVMEFSASADPGDAAAIQRFAVETAFEVNARHPSIADRCDRLWDTMTARGTAAMARVGAADRMVP
jgi:anaerobic magnesium-protoporphyrin IX monomethyl ester cyclase